MKSFHILVAVIITILGFSADTNAQIKFSGDAAVRGRYDITDYHNYGKKTKTEDFYYMYRARLNMLAEIGEGWYFKTQLSHAGNSNYANVGTEDAAKGEVRTTNSIDGSIKSAVYFNQLYFGRSTENWSFAGGLIYLNGQANPMLDLHFYADKMVDIPYSLNSNNSAFGFTNTVKVGPGKLTAIIMADNNKGKYVEDPDGKELQDTKDGYTFGLDYEFSISDFTFQPVIMYAIAKDSVKAPFTAGLNFKSPKFSGITLSSSAGYSKQDNKGATEYDAWYLRLKANVEIGPGTIEAWYDMANRTDKLKTGDDSHDFSYLWAKYIVPVYKSKIGRVDIEPTVRIATEKADKKVDYSRSKIEITTSIYFN
jgi:hypothetical protein